MNTTNSRKERTISGGGGEDDKIDHHIGIEMIDNNRSDFSKENEHSIHNINNTTISATSGDHKYHEDDDDDPNQDTSKDALLTHFERSQSSLHTAQNLINTLHINEKNALDSQNNNSNSNNSHSDQTFKIAMVIFFYFFISISLVFSNKLLMKNMDFNYPIFITWYQQVVSFLLIWVMCTISPSFPALSFLPPFEFKSHIAYQVLPLTSILTGMITLNNLCLEYVEVSFYQIARSLAICFSLILTYVILKTKTSFKASMACILVFFGFILGVMGEVNFSWLGVIFGVLSSLFVALYSIYVKRVLPACDQNEWKLSIYNTAISIVLILPLSVMAGEFKTIWMEPIIYTGQFWLMMTIAGAMGYLISIAVFMQIKHTSPLTNSISATLKSCLQTVLAVWFWGNEITFTNAIGIIMVIFGSFYYSYVRYQEMKK